MQRLVILALVALLFLPVVASAQRYVSQNETIEYTLTVGDDKPFRVSTASVVRGMDPSVSAWWKPFLAKNTREGDRFDLNTIPLTDRPQLGDKAVVLKVGGVAQFVQVIELAPGAETKWHGYGWDGEALFYVLSGRGETDYRPPGGLPPGKYTWKRDSMFAVAVDHQMRHRNLDRTQPLRLLAVVGYAINLYPYVAEEKRHVVSNPAENPTERAATLARSTYPGHYVDDLREHPVAMREARGNRTAFFNMMSVVGHRTHDNVHISELTGPEAYAHRHGNSPIFVILKGAGYDIWSPAENLEGYHADVKAGRAHKAPYQVGTLCGVPAGPHWHHHFSTGTEPLRYLAIVPRGAYEEKPASQN